jgi:hypothetical protein
MSNQPCDGSLEPGSAAVSSSIRSPSRATTLEELRWHSVRAVLDAESLLHIPLVMQAFSDLRFRFIPRSTDVRWTHRKRVPIEFPSPRAQAAFSKAGGSDIRNS